MRANFEIIWSGMEVRMENKDLKLFEIEENVFIVDTSGPTPNGEALRRQVDAIFREVNERFDATKIERVTALRKLEAAGE